MADSSTLSTTSLLACLAVLIVLIISASQAFGTIFTDIFTSKRMRRRGPDEPGNGQEMMPPGMSPNGAMDPNGAMNPAMAMPGFAGNSNSGMAADGSMGPAGPATNPQPGIQGLLAGTDIDSAAAISIAVLALGALIALMGVAYWSNPKVSKFGSSSNPNVELGLAGRHTVSNCYECTCEAFAQVHQPGGSAAQLECRVMRVLYAEPQVERAV